MGKLGKKKKMQFEILNLQSTVRIIYSNELKNQLFIAFSHQLQSVLYHWIFAIMQYGTFFNFE